MALNTQAFHERDHTDNKNGKLKIHEELTSARNAAFTMNAV
jgi:hypothetical protein